MGIWSRDNWTKVKGLTVDTMLALGKVVAQRVKVAAIGSPQSLENLQAQYPGGLVAPAASGGRTLGALLGGGLGALGGGAHGLAFPGRDEEGKERSRVREALKRALMVGIPGAVVGGWGGRAVGGGAATIVERDLANRKQLESSSNMIEKLKRDLATQTANRRPY